MNMHPEYNICENCDYKPHICELPITHTRRKLAKQFADIVFVTTPDMKDFLSDAIHFPFFSPVDDIQPPEIDPRELWPNRSGFKIVHATNHPGTKGRKKSSRYVVNKDMICINLVILQNVTLDVVCRIG